MRPMRCSKDQLMHQISVVSFAAYDMLLYLDTHPDDTNALAYYREQCDIRRQLLNDYASQFGPLTADYACKNTSAEWDWVMQPWPWEACQKGGSSECGIMKKDCSFR